MSTGSTWGTINPDDKDTTTNKLKEILPGVAIANSRWAIANNTGKRVVLMDVFNNKTTLQPRKTNLGYAMEDSVVIDVENSTYKAKPRKERATISSGETFALEKGSDPNAKSKHIECTLDQLTVKKSIFVKELNLLLYLEKDTPEEDAEMIHPFSTECIAKKENAYRKDIYDTYINTTPSIAMVVNLNKEQFDLTELHVEMLGILFRVKVTNIGDDNTLTILHSHGDDSNEIEKKNIIIDLSNINKDGYVIHDIGNNPYAVIIGINGIDLYTARDNVSKKYNPIALKEDIKILKHDHKLEIQKLTDNKNISIEEYKKKLQTSDDTITNLKIDNKRIVQNLNDSANVLRVDNKREICNLTDTIDTLKLDNKRTINILKQDHKGEVKELNNNINILKQDNTDKVKELNTTINILKQDHVDKVKELTNTTNILKQDNKDRIKKLTNTIDVLKQDHKGEVKELNYDINTIKQDHKDKLKEVDTKNKQWSKDTIGKVILHAVTVVLNIFKDIFMLKWVVA